METNLKITQQQKSPNPKIVRSSFRVLAKNLFRLNNFVNLKSNLALLYNKGHNLLTSALPKNVKLIEFPILALNDLKVFLVSNTNKWTLSIIVTAGSDFD